MQGDVTCGRMVATVNDAISRRSTGCLCLTGAGVSAESGLPTFRGMNGLWRGYRVEDVASSGGVSPPIRRWCGSSIRSGGDEHATVEPNPAHFALAELEREAGRSVLSCARRMSIRCTSRRVRGRVVHMHGRILQSRCSDARCDSRPFDDRNEHYGEQATRFRDASSAGR